MASLQEQVLSKKGDKIKGVFSTQKVMKIGTGTTSRKTIQQALYYVQENDDGGIEIQPLNRNYIPSGKSSVVSKDDLLRRFTPEPEFYVSTVQPRLRELEDFVERGDEKREAGAVYGAQYEYGNAVALDEDNVRANFGIGLCYLERGETAKANDILKRIVKLEAAFEPEHKHLFNEFGINLRKTGMFDQAIDYYTRAMELCQGDDHLHYNLAKALVGKGDTAAAVEQLETALELNSELEPAKELLEQIAQRTDGDRDPGLTPPSKQSTDPQPSTAG